MIFAYTHCLENHIALDRALGAHGVQAQLHIQVENMCRHAIHGLLILEVNQGLAIRAQGYS